MTKDELIELAQVGMGIHSPNAPEYIVCEALIKALAQPEREPVAWATREDFYFELNRRVDRMREEMMIKTVTMRCKEYDLALPIVDMYGGHIVVGQVSFPPKRKPLTDEEIDELSRSMVKGDKSVNWLCRAIEAAHGIKGGEA